MSTVSGRTSWKKAFIQRVRRMPRGASVISICPILMAMSFHLLVRSSGSLCAQDGSPLQRPEQEFARELAQPGPGLLCSQSDRWLDPTHSSALWIFRVLCSRISERKCLLSLMYGKDQPHTNQETADATISLQQARRSDAGTG